MINLRDPYSHHRISLGLLAVLLIALASNRADAAGPAATQHPSDECRTAEVMVERNADYAETTYGISCKNCRIEWIARDAEVGVVKLWSQCSLPLSEQMPLLNRIYDHFLRRDRNARALRTLFMGEIDPDAEAGSREMSIRLALAAHKSSGWDARKGEAKSGDMNGFVKDLANREMIYSELKELFTRFQQDVKISCVEKVLVQQADKLPYFDQLNKQGVQATDKLPFDCMTWFAIAAEQE